MAYDPATLFSRTLERDGWPLPDVDLGRLARLLILINHAPHGRIQTDLRWLAKRLGISREDVQLSFEPLLKASCETDGTWWWHRRLYHGRAHLAGLPEMQQARIRRAWGDKPDPRPPISDRVAFKRALRRAREGES